MYDVVAGSKTLKNSYYLSKKNALELFPMLKGNALCGGIVYYDGKQLSLSIYGQALTSWWSGQQDDARMNLAIALTAARLGASVINHVKVTGLIKEKNKDGREVICGVNCRDEMTGNFIPTLLVTIC